MVPFPVRPADILLRRDLLARGFSDRHIRYAVRGGGLVKVRYGAYVPAELVDGMDEVQLMRVRARAVLRTAHPSSVLSHHSALAEYGVPLWGLGLDEIHLTRTDQQSGRREAGVVHHATSTAGPDWSALEGVPVMAPARAVLETLTMTTPECAMVVASGALNAGLVTHADLENVWLRTQRWPRSRATRLVLASADARLESVGESRSWHLFHAHHLPLPVPQVRVEDDSGRLIGYVDFAWLAHGVFLEFDGRVKYQQHRRPGESLEDYIRREKRREERICAATGWACMRITWADLSQPYETARRIRSLLESRGRLVA